VNYLDIIFVLLLVWAGWTGFKKGFILELFTLLALFLGLYAGIHFSDFAARVLKESVGVESEYMPVIAFTITFLAVGAMVYFGGKALERVVKVVQLTPLNKMAGIALGVLKMTFFIGGFILISESFDEKNDVVDEQTKTQSLLFYPIKSITTTTIPAFEESTMFLKNTLQNKGSITFK